MPRKRPVVTAARLARLQGAVRAPLPDAIRPQLATAVKRPPAGPDWVYEIKFDGYRFLVRKAQDEVRLFTREGHDWTARLKAQAQAIAVLSSESVWLDGEMVLLDETGMPSFGLLQHAFAKRRTESVAYFVFDMLYLNGYDLRAVRQEERRGLLRELLQEEDDEHVRYSESFDRSAQDIVAAARSLNLEGVVGKRSGAAYRAGRSPDWVKFKCYKRQEFVVGGYTAPSRTSTDVQYLALGVYEDSALKYVGKVPATMAARYLKRLAASMAPHVRRTSPFVETASVDQRGSWHWLEPVLVVEVSFLEWTRAGRLRQPVLIGLREDKPATQVVREREG